MSLIHDTNNSKTQFALIQMSPHLYTTSILQGDKVNKKRIITQASILNMNHDQRHLASDHVEDVIPDEWMEL